MRTLLKRFDVSVGKKKTIDAHGLKIQEKVHEVLDLFLRVSLIVWALKKERFPYFGFKWMFINIFLTKILFLSSAPHCFYPLNPLFASMKDGLHEMHQRSFWAKSFVTIFRHPQIAESRKCFHYYCLTFDFHKQWNEIHISRISKNVFG